MASYGLVEKKGTPEKEVQKVQKVQNGLVTTYYANGMKATEAYYTNGFLDGQYIKYHQQYIYNGQKKKDIDQLIGNYKNGQKDGIFIEYNYNGTLYRIDTHKKDILDGPCELYYQHGKLAGQLHKKNNYVNGKIEGKMEEYLDGKIIKDYPYINGKKNGTCREYYPNGKCKKEESFVNDIQKGLSIEHYTNGNTRLVLRNFKSGDYINYYPNGHRKFYMQHKKRTHTNTMKYTKFHKNDYIMIDNKGPKYYKLCYKNKRILFF